MSRAAATAVLVLLVSLAGCVSPPPRVQTEIDVAAPERWSAPGTNPDAVKDAWWTTFEDPELERLIESALANNHDLRAAVARLDRAAAEARIAGADLKPTVGAGLSGSRQRQNFVGFPIPGGESGVLSTTATRVGVSIDTSWEADLWGRLRAQARSALAELQATRADLDAAHQSLAAQTAKAWFALTEAFRQVQLARSSADSYRGLARQVRSRYELGVRPALDLRLALSNQYTAEATLARRRRELDRGARQLEILLGGYPEGSLVERFSPKAHESFPPPVPAGLPADLVSRRPDLVSAERRLAAADQRLVSARRSLYPRLSLTANGGTVSNELSDLLDGDFRVWSLVANLTQPLFQGGRLRAGVERAGATVEELRAIYASTALRAYSEVETTLAAEAHLAEQELRLGDAVEQLVAAVRLAEQRYRSGVGDYLSVLDSQTRSFLAQSQLLDLHRARLANRVDLHLALGGSFQSASTATSGGTP